MSTSQNQGGGQNPSTPNPPPTSITGTFSNPKLVGTEKKSDSKPRSNTAVRPSNNTERR